jgi:hypothetical protein
LAWYLLRGRVKAATRWLSALEIAQRADVHERTARQHASKLAQLGIFEEARLSPGFLYRHRRIEPQNFAAPAAGREHLIELERAALVR